MLRSLFIIATLLLLTACSELRVFGNAALKELKADGVNTEKLAYQQKK